MNDLTPRIMKKSKSWDPFWIYRLISKANLAKIHSIHSHFCHLFFSLWVMCCRCCRRCCCCFARSSVEVTTAACCLRICLKSGSMYSWVTEWSDKKIAWLPRPRQRRRRRLGGIGAGATRNEGGEEGAKIFVSTNISLRKFQIIRMKLE